MENDQTLKIPELHFRIKLSIRPKKIPESRILYLEKYDEHTYHFAMEVFSPLTEAKINYLYAEALLFV